MSDHECDREKSDVSTRSKLRLHETGGGYLVFRIWLTYEPVFDNEFISGHRLLGAAEVEDRRLVRQELRDHGYDPDILDYLPEL